MLNHVLITEPFHSAEVLSAYPHISFSLQPELWQHPSALCEAIADFDGLIVCNQTQVNARIIASAPNLKVIGRLGVGLDNIDVTVARKAGIQVVYAPQANTVSVAEYCLAQIFNILRKLPPAIISTSDGGWERQRFTGRELSEIVVGLIGFGHTASALAQRLRSLGGSVIVYTRSPGKVPPVLPTFPLDELLRRADIVSLHVPGTSETEGMLGAAEFRAMKATAWLINAARGSVVDESALCDAIVSGEIAGAALDVRATEPPLKGALAQLPNLYPTPHTAAFTRAAHIRVAQTVISDVDAVLNQCAPRYPAP